MSRPPRPSTIYAINWTDSVTRSTASDPARFDNLIRFQPGASEHLVRLSPLLRPVIQRDWSSLVARYNRTLVPDTELDEFLFGPPDRPALTPLRDPLAELQSNRCFYCADPLRRKLCIDHFIPRSRHPDDSLGNLVLTHERCSAAKSAHLAAAAHVENWLAWTTRHATDLDTLAHELRWDRHPDRTRNAARAIYLRLPDGLKLWRAGTDFVSLDREEILRALGR